MPQITKTQLAAAFKAWNKTLADKFGAYPYLIALSPAPPPAPTPPPGA
jgi:hypothetical protein